MIEMKKIADFSDRIAREFKPEKIILFGSYASGKPTRDSDVDMMIIMKFKGKSAWKSIEILNKIEPRFPVDLVVRTPAEIRKRILWNDFFIKDIVEKGKVLYEAGNPRVG